MISRRKVTLGVGAAVLVAAAGGGVAWGVVAANHGSDRSGATEEKPSGSVTEKAADAENDSDQEKSESETPAYDIDSPDSITVVVNKQRPFAPIDWAPEDLVYPDVENNNGQPLRAVASAALEEMNRAATEAGYPLIIASAYRSYSEQDSLFNRYAESDGAEAADRYSARAGFSEHQTGLVVDLTDGGACTLEECFGETSTGGWLRDNAWRFGYILRYNDGEESTVGYTYEPWHFRYVGTEVSTAMHEQGVNNLEDFFGLPAAPSY